MKTFDEMFKALKNSYYLLYYFFAKVGTFYGYYLYLLYI